MEAWEMNVGNRKNKKIGQYGKTLTENVHIKVTETMKLEIQKLIERGLFPSESEFGRFAIRTYLDRAYEYELIRWKRGL